MKHGCRELLPREVEGWQDTGHLTHSDPENQSVGVNSHLVKDYFMFSKVQLCSASNRVRVQGLGEGSPWSVSGIDMMKMFLVKMWGWYGVRVKHQFDYGTRLEVNVWRKAADLQKL